MARADDEDAIAHGGGAAEPDEPSPPADEVAGGGRGTGDIHTYIGSRLRQAFDDIAAQPVPDRFLQLMRDLDKA